MKIFFYIIFLPIFLKGQSNYKSLPNYQVPVLCYHNVTKNEDKKGALWISEKQLNAQFKALHDSGYHTILPEQLYQYLTKQAPLPSKPIILTFDDTHEEHFSIVANVLNKYGYKGVFFIMTICIGKKRYLTSQQIKALSDNGHVIACHTYDHPLFQN